MIDADLAMYDAKDAGGDGFAFFAADADAPRTRTRITWRDRIVDALANDRFALVAQPVFDATSCTATQYELLLRMTGPHGTLIPPAAFLSIAERDGLIVAIDQWVVRRADRAAGRARAGRQTGPARGQHKRPLARRHDADGADRRRSCARPASTRAT